MPVAESTAVVATKNGVARYRHYFRRDDLYRLVWTSPVSEVAARLGVSDVALAKLCRRAAVPMPGRGYWQRTEAGQAIEPVPLGEAPKGLPEWLKIRGEKPAIATHGQSSNADKRTQKSKGKGTRIARVMQETAPAAAAVSDMSGEDLRVEG